MSLLFGCLIVAGIFTGLLIALDVRHHPPHMKIMKVTWPVTGLYMPVFGWWVWRSLGKSSSHNHHSSHSHRAQGSGGAQEQHSSQKMPPKIDGNEAQPGHNYSIFHEHQEHREHPGAHENASLSWRSACVSATHCGAGCVIGDILAAPVAGLTHFQVAGSAFIGHTLLSLVAAFFIGILFQYLPIREMGEPSPKRAMINAVKADTFSLLCFQAGMFIFLWLVRGGDLYQPVEAASLYFWGKMIIAMFVGYLVSVPVNYRLIKAGIKHGM